VHGATGVLLCPPDHFDVVDVKNPFMEGQTGQVDRARAQAQWDALAQAFRATGLAVEVLPALPGCEDMVFTANPSFTGPGASGERICVLSRMRFPSRQPEVDAHEAWFRARGYRTVRSSERFEGGGDAIWHPGERVIWGGCGPRSVAAAYPFLAEVFGVEVVTLELATADFYHLDTCFCPLDRHTVLLYPAAFTPAGLARIRERFPRVLEADAADARDRFACNAAAHDGHVILERGSARVEASLRALGFEVHAVETGEFLKSGGSVYCMKQWLFE